jgi:hypothetical protein
LTVAGNSARHDVDEYLRAAADLGRKTPGSPRRPLVCRLPLGSQRRLFSHRLARARPTVPRWLPAPSGLRRTEGDAFTFIEGREPGWRESRDVDEYVLAATIASDEVEAFLDIEPLHGAGLFDRCTRRWPPRCLEPGFAEACHRHCETHIYMLTISPVSVKTPFPQQVRDRAVRIFRTR